MTTNQAVVFTKPLHHLDIALAPSDLDRFARNFFHERGLSIVFSKSVTGPELARRETIRQHYLMYSKASYGDIRITDEGRERFRAAFGKTWNAEVEAGRIMGNPALLERKKMRADDLFELWSRAAANRIQSGLLMAWIEPLDCFAINAFYPAMEANFYHPATRIDYYVVEFDPAVVDWRAFRREVLGSTNAAKAEPGSIRGRLYAQYPVPFPGRDNFLHGSAGPFEALVERAIHEPELDMASNPVGRHLETLGVTLERLKQWRSQQPIADLANLFDATEEKDSDAIFPILERIAWR